VALKDDTTKHNVVARLATRVAHRARFMIGRDLGYGRREMRDQIDPVAHHTDERAPSISKEILHFAGASNWGRRRITQCRLSEAMVFSSRKDGWDRLATGTDLSAELASRPSHLRRLDASWARLACARPKTQGAVTL
jgi:hypothetical protein